MYAKHIQNQYLANKCYYNVFKNSLTQVVYSSIIGIHIFMCKLGGTSNEKINKFDFGSNDGIIISSMCSAGTDYTAGRRKTC